MDNDLDGVSQEHLLAEVVRLRDGIRKHRDEEGHERCKLSDDRLYSLLPEGYEKKRQLPPECEWMTECNRFWRNRQDNHVPNPEYQGVVVTGIPGGDGECWHFEVTKDEFVRVVGEENAQIEFKWREEFGEKGPCTLSPDELLKAVGSEVGKPVTLWIQARLAEL